MLLSEVFELKSFLTKVTILEHIHLFEDDGINHLKLQMEIAKSYWVDTKDKYDYRISRIGKSMF